MNLKKRKASVCLFLKQNKTKKGAIFSSIPGLKLKVCIGIKTPFIFQKVDFQKVFGYNLPTSLISVND